ncbi:MAG: type I polyketide synthase [Pseudomonadota bacterium]
MKNDNETLKALYKTLKTTQKRLYEIENAGREPIAVIGMACRFPGGASTIAKYRALLESGGDAICEVPPARWDGPRYYDPDPEVPGKVTTNRAGFLKEPIDGFDSAFFHLSPKEVQSIDPQQRLLLEVCWEAFENAGIDITTLKGSGTGVFCGIANSDYAAAHLRSGDPEKIDAYSVTGTALSAAVGRISYLFGFEGPNMALDTACSSSLVAVHLACRSLRSGESDMAVAAGINLILTPEGHIGFSKIRALSPDGRCKSFDDSADGYGRGEGCGLIVLKRLSDAKKNNDPIQAVIRGSAVNQDGRTNGFTAPSSLSQEKVLRKALADSALGPGDIGCIEAHGTGTSLGDPIEMEAIGKVYSPGREMGRPLYVGSVKANIGHLEAAAGIAGLIKAVMMLDGARIFPQIHFSKPNRHIPWDQLAVKIPLESMPWQRKKAPLAVGVSSFGFSGTNAHVILQEADSPPIEEHAPERSHHILNISANDREGLGDLMALYHGFLADTDSRIGDICHTASVGRMHFPHRVSVVGRTRQELREALDARINEKTPENASRADGPEKSDKRIVFLFTGQGSQYPKMAWDLYASQPVFRDEMERCAVLLQPHMARSLIDLLYEDDISSLHETRHTQPVIFCVEYALAKLLESWGIKPSLVMGHSIGEYVAATLAGVFELEDALGLVAARGRLVQSLPASGGMAVIVAGEQRVAEAIGSCGRKVSIAAVNAPRNTVISGEKEAVEGLCARFRKERVASHVLNVSHAFHSWLLDPVIEPFGALAAGIGYAPPKLPIMANVTGGPGGAEMAASDYWTRHLREPVRFFDSMRAVAEAGYGIFLEVGATSTLTSLGRQCIPEHGGIWLSTLGSRDFTANLRPGRIEGRSDWEPMLSGLAGLYTAGCDIDWEGFDRPYPRKRIGLPNYPFQRKRCWIELPCSGEKQMRRSVPSVSVGTGGGPAPEAVSLSDVAAAGAMRIEGDAEDIIRLQMDLMSGQLKVMSEQLDALSETGEEGDDHASPIRDLRWNREKE